MSTRAGALAEFYLAPKLVYSTPARAEYRAEQAGTAI